MVSIRGATTIEKNEEAEILSGTTELLKELIKHNNLDISKIIAIFFTCTEDITSAYPAKAARMLGLNNASLMCLQEMFVENSLNKCIRACVFYDDNIKQSVVKHIYINGATALRPDWSIV